LGVAGERDFAEGVEQLGSPHEADVALANQVAKGQPEALIIEGDAHHPGQVAQHKLPSA